MKYNIVQFNQLLRHSNYTPNFNINFPELEKRYLAFLKGYKSIKLRKLVKIKSNTTIKKGNLVTYKNSFHDLNIYLADKPETPSINKTVIYPKGKHLTESYILWALHQKPVREYLGMFRKGSFISYVSINDLLNTKIPLEKKHIRENNRILFTSKSPFKKTIHDYLISEYYKCVEHKLYLPALVLMGTVCEALLLQIAQIKKINLKHLEGKTLGRIVEYMKIENIFTEQEINLFNTINDARNHIHVNKLITKSIKLDSLFTNAETAFNEIIKSFGL